MKKLVLAFLGLSLSFSTTYAFSDLQQLRVESVVCDYESKNCSVVGETVSSAPQLVALVFNAESFVASEFGEYFEADADDLKTLWGKGVFRPIGSHLSTEAQQIGKAFTGVDVEVGYDFRNSPHEDIGYYFMSEIRYGNESSF